MPFVLAFGALDMLAFGAPTPNAAFVLAFGALDVLAFGAPTPNAMFVSAFAAFVLAFGALDVLAFGAPTWMCWRSGPRPRTPCLYRRLPRLCQRSEPRPECVSVRGTDPERRAPNAQACTHWERGGD